jgi:hypothetical protein
MNKLMALQFLRNLGHENGVTEIRILGASFYGNQLLRKNGATVSGYYDPDHYEEAVEHMERFDGIGNIYCCLNPAHPDLIARSRNCLRSYPKATTGDDEVINLNWLPVDVDPYRPAGIPSNYRPL